MNQPTLFFNNTLISLKETQPNLFEPKDLNLLLTEVLKLKDITNKSSFFGDGCNQFYPFRVSGGLPVVIFGDAGSHSSLSVITTNLAKSLHRLGVNVSIKHCSKKPVEDLDYWILNRHFITEEPKEPYAAIFIDRFKPKNLNESLIKFSAVVDGCDSFITYNPDKIKEYNQKSHVFTYSSYSQNVMRELGVNNSIVMPLGVDTSIFYPRDVLELFEFSENNVVFKNFHENSTGNRFIFLMAGMMQDRKGVTEALSAYRKAFAGRDDVLFWVHGRTNNWGMDESIKMHDSGPPMVWTDSSINDEDMAKLLSRADCYVSTHKLEGFGLMPLQAMSCGTPCIMSNYSGPKDYANETNVLIVPHLEQDSNQTYIPREARYGILKEQDIIDKMLLIFESSEERSRLSLAGLETAKKWSWDTSARVVLGSIKAKGLEVSRRLPLDNSKIDILIPVRNGSKDINKLLTSLCEVSSGAEFSVMICDDGSLDDTWETLQAWEVKSKPFNLKIFKNEVALGAGATRNKLLSESGGEFCLFADCDLVFNQENWLRDLLKAVRVKPNHIIAPMLTENGKISSAGGDLDKLGVPTVHRFLGEDISLKSANIACEVICSPGAALFFRRAILDEIGGFWEDYTPNTFEDTDWLMKARRHGFKVWYYPDVKIIHNCGSFRSKSDARGDFCRNREKFLVQWPELPI